MKILHMIYDHSRNPWVGGGGAVRVYEICRRLVRRGHEVTILSGNYPGAADYAEDGLRFVFSGNAKNYILSTFSYAWKAASLVRTQGHRFDIIIEDFASWNPVFSPLFTKTPVVLHVNHREGSNILRRWLLAGLPFYLIEKFYPRAYRHVTALSVETRKKIGMAGAMIVPAGIDEDFLKDADVQTNGESRNFLLYIGRLHIRNKGLDTLLSAMNGLDAKLLIAGRGKDEDSLKQKKQSLGLKNTDFSGFVSEGEKKHLLQNAAALVLPSRFEGWGIVVLEAAACGKPAIVSDIPELRYAVDAGFGISFRTGDAKDLAEKINFLLENEQLRKEMGLKAREYAKNCTWDKITLDYEQFLMEVIG